MAPRLTAAKVTIRILNRTTRNRVTPSENRETRRITFQAHGSRTIADRKMEETGPETRETMVRTDINIEIRTIAVSRPRWSTKRRTIINRVATKWRMARWTRKLIKRTKIAGPRKRTIGSNINRMIKTIEILMLASKTQKTLFRDLTRQLKTVITTMASSTMCRRRSSALCLRLGYRLKTLTSIQWMVSSSNKWMVSTKVRYSIHTVAKLIKLLCAIFQFNHQRWV